jgi:uncharacterized protein DUF6152
MNGMLRRKLTTVVVGLGVVLAAAPLWAHHAFSAEFDAEKHLKFTGTLVKMEWTNPHTWLHIEVKKPDGTVEEWAVEAGTPSALLRRGLSKSNLPPGIEIAVDGYQAKDGSQRMNGRDLKFADGRSFLLGSSGTGAPSETATPASAK